jgi:hypothetical protein
MATAVRQPVDPQYQYVLTLSEAEAQALLDLTWCIGGPSSGERGYFTDGPSNIANVLTQAGLLHRFEHCRGVVTFPGREVSDVRQ